MFGISLGELIIVAIIFIIFVPPEQIPSTVGKIWGMILRFKESLSTMASDLSQLEHLSKEGGGDPETIEYNKRNKSNKHEQRNKESGK